MLPHGKTPAVAQQWLLDSKMMKKERDDNYKTGDQYREKGVLMLSALIIMAWQYSSSSWIAVWRVTKLMSV